MNKTQQWNLERKFAAAEDAGCVRLELERTDLGYDAHTGGSRERWAWRALYRTPDAGAWTLAGTEVEHMPGGAREAESRFRGELMAGLLESLTAAVKARAAELVAV